MPRLPADLGSGDAPQSRRQKDLAATRKLLSQAKDLISNVEESYIMQKQGPRQYPTFSGSEIARGPLLGVGGFGIVWEVKDFKLKIPKEVELPIVLPKKPEEEVNKKEHTSEMMETNAASAEEENFTQTHATDEEETSSTSVSQPNDTPQSQQAPPAPAQQQQQQKASAQEEEELNSFPTEEIMLTIAPDDSHYDVKNARYMMAKHARRKGSSRYAIKKLHSDLNDLERTRGMIDMALEVKYLSVMWHPNIVKMRGYAAGPILSPNFFFIMDRLYGILDTKIKSWSSIARKNRGGFLGRGADKLKLQELMVERLIVAYDLAAAFWYMHENKLVYRDIKQENIGFDIRGDVKVFDFGLSKSLSPKLKNDGYGYNLTFRTGSVPYMAPEVAECQPYDIQCDVFSFAILLWEILSMKPAFKGYTRREFLMRVVRGRERQSVSRKWPPLTRLAIREAWEHDAQKRPDMKRIASLLRGDLNELSSDPKVQDRTAHMRERSSHSTRLSRALSLRNESGGVSR